MLLDSGNSLGFWKGCKRKIGLILDKCAHMWFDLGLEVFLKKGENCLLNFEEFPGGSEGGNWFDLSTFKICRLRHFFVACI